MPAWAGTRNRLLDPEFLILSTHGGLRAENGEAIALGFHTGHWEVGLLVAEAARELKSLRATPFAGACTDPCDGRTQGTTGMMDSLPYRNDAAIVLRRLMRSLPTGKGVHRRGHLRQGTARDDDGAGVVRRKARGAGSRRRDAAAGAGRGRGARCRPSARALRRTRSRWNTRPRWAAAPAHRPAAAASFWAPRPRRRWWARRSGSRCRTRRLRLQASRSGSMRRAARPARCCGCISSASARATFLRPRPSATPWCCTRRSADRRIC